MTNELSQLSASELLKLKEIKSYEEIATDYNVSVAFVQRLYRSRGISRSKTIVDALSTSEMLDLRLKGLSYSEVASKYGVCENTVRREYKARGLGDITISNRFLDKYDDYDLVDLKIRLKTAHNVADHLGVSVSLVNKEFAKRGINNKCKVRLNTLINELKDRDNCSYEEIAYRLGVSVNTIYRYK